MAVPPSFRLPALPDLPIVAALPELLAALDHHSRVVLEAPPGAGKTTVVPLALLAAAWRAPDDKILVLEPRQLAARAAAARLAHLLGEPMGQTVGYRVRLDSKVSAATRVEVITEGILTRMMQDDPALEGVACVVFDEFHERSLNADLGLALALDAQAVLRPELKILLMSATLEAGRLGQWLPAPVVTSAGFLFPIETHYLDPRQAAALPNRPGERLTALVPGQVRAALVAHQGDILVFLPGVADLQRIQKRLTDLPATVAVHLLHGELPLDAQDAALRNAAPGHRKVILATSIAETSLTIEGVRVVIDGGFARVPRFLPRTGFTTLETVPVSQAAADQRRGRAGRVAPGTCYRLWTQAEQHQLPTHKAPEIQTADLSGLTLELALWGVQEPSSLRWLDAPPAAAMDQARELLVRLGALAFNEQLVMSNDQLSSANYSLLITNCSLKATAHGKALAKLGLPPRLGHLVVRGTELGHGRAATELAALLAERELLRWADPTDPRPLPPDLRLRLEALRTGRAPLPGLALHHATLPRIREVARQLGQRQKAGSSGARYGRAGARALRGCAAGPGLSRPAGPARNCRSAPAYHRAAREPENRGCRPAGYVFRRGPPRGHRCRAARHAGRGPVSRPELEAAFDEQITTTDEVRYDPAAQRVTGRRVRRLGALLLGETVIGQPDAALVAQALLAYVQEAGLSKLNWTPEARQLQHRLGVYAPAFRPARRRCCLARHRRSYPGRRAAHLARPHLAGLKSLADIQRLDLREPLLARLPGGWAQRQELDRLAPAALEVPSGSHITINYENPAAPVLAVKLQELFGLLDTPTVGGPARVPVLLHLLSPGGKPAQVTRDLRSFWASGYFEVRKELRGRYPKHPWPDDPLTHIPTKLTKKRLGQ